MWFSKTQFFSRHFPWIFPHFPHKLMTRHDQDVMSIMSGDSPNANRSDVFDFKEVADSAGPSKEPQIQTSSHVQASVLVEPDKDEEEKPALCSPILNNSNCDDNRLLEQEKTSRVDDVDYEDKKKKDDKDEKRKLNGDFDNVDAVRTSKQISKKPLEQEEDDNCTVQCLYYTLACCECVIV